MAQSKSLQSLNLGNSAIGGDAAVGAAKALAQSTSLQALFLGNNEIGEAAVGVAEALAQSKSLRTLNLEGNRIGEAAVGVAEALAQSKSLRSLGLGVNGIKADVLAIVEDIMEKRKMDRLAADKVKEENEREEKMYKAQIVEEQRLLKETTQKLIKAEATTAKLVKEKTAREKDLEQDKKAKAAEAAEAARLLKETNQKLAEAEDTIAELVQEKTAREKALEQENKAKAAKAAEAAKTLDDFKSDTKAAIAVSKNKKATLEESRASSAVAEELVNEAKKGIKAQEEVIGQIQVKEKASIVLAQQYEAALAEAASITEEAEKVTQEKFAAAKEAGKEKRKEKRKEAVDAQAKLEKAEAKADEASTLAENARAMESEAAEEKILALEELKNLTEKLKQLEEKAALALELVQDTQAELVASESYAHKAAQAEHVKQSEEDAKQQPFLDLAAERSKNQDLLEENEQIKAGLVEEQARTTTMRLELAESMMQTAQAEARAAEAQLALASSNQEVPTELPLAEAVAMTSAIGAAEEIEEVLEKKAEENKEVIEINDSAEDHDIEPSAFEGVARFMAESSSEVNSAEEETEVLVEKEVADPATITDTELGDSMIVVDSENTEEAPQLEYDFSASMLRMFDQEQSLEEMRAIAGEFGLSDSCIEGDY